MRGPLAILISVATLVSASWEASIAVNLEPLLSKHAKIIVAGDESFHEKTNRWQWWEAPNVKAVVEVQNEDDVRQTILYANKIDIPFFAQSGGHGSISSLGKIRDGIQISMRGMNSIEVADDGTYATLGGGVKVKEVMDALWAVGKQTVTGLCECVGLTAVALGGGHGILQGYYGLLSDQIISARLVLANGTAITVSETERPDLFWALQGAGHNFGIVTSLDYRIYDVDNVPGKGVWSYEVFVLEATEDNVRSMYEESKKMLNAERGRSHPEGLMIYALVMTNPVVSEKPIIVHHVIWNGPLSTIKTYTQAFHNLSPISVASEEGTYLDVPRFLQTNLDSLVCHASDLVPGAGIVRSPVDMRDYNIEALVVAVEKFKEVTREIVEFAGSFFMIEQYATQAVTRREDKSSAFPSRKDRLLFAPALYYPSMNVETGKPLNKTLDELAIEKSLEIRQSLINGAKSDGGSRAYVNYAHGSETVEEMYGQEKWRLEKLRDLKRRYDPWNRFRFYAPIEPAESEQGGHSEL